MQHRRRRTNLASVLKEVSVALVDKDVTYDPQAENVPFPMDRLKGRHFLSMCPSNKASDSRGKKAQRQCKVCAARAKTTGQTPTERENKRRLTTTWCRECKVGLCLTVLIFTTQNVTILLSRNLFKRIIILI
ncbi:hypothetical protein PoB_003453700 [Plakobranchus ocellatus]|uniref:PiggyBac transposable element-derived protein 4 C-terminal zinc-ribbon domain-containing protein n=1 Tax=Plakobranchus ocellatus TaxID=259542 RepID=A0AAV4ALB4_9GAST|nr:hypothetical protein PoB_003453700 [Plakobranchus ocellatus]